MFRPAMKYLATLLVSFCVLLSPLSAGVEEVRFQAGDLELSGVLTTPPSGKVKSIVILVHGYGETSVVENNWYFGLRNHLARAGVATFMWDKPGCGTSEGEFDANQSVESSAQEVVAAAQYLRDRGVAGADAIGLWGVSRAGWIAPLAMARDKKLKFWISVSGVDEKESFGYLLQSNWRLEGYSPEKVTRLYQQWMDGNDIVFAGGSYEQYLEATGELRGDEFFSFISPQSAQLSRDGFMQWVANTRELAQPRDPETGLAIYVEGFAELLAGLDVPVLAIFGAKDSIVDWRSTRHLYERTIGRNEKASLKITEFADGNHNLHQSETGGFREMLEILNAPQMVDGYYTVIVDWMTEGGLAEPGSGLSAESDDTVLKS